jgi:hypothetical protein
MAEKLEKRVLLADGYKQRIKLGANVELSIKYSRQHLHPLEDVSLLNP